jgi:iron-sulfur cluster repair di-iron protein
MQGVLEIRQYSLMRGDDTMEQTTVRNIVAEDFRTASIFEKHSIDFCCHGNVALEEACEKSGAAVGEVRAELALLSSADKNKEEAYDTWELDRLVDHIVQTHHRYVKEAIPVILTHTGKVALKHGERHPEVMQIQGWFRELGEEMTRHMAKEEMVLFPYIKAIVKSQRDGIQLPRPHFGTIQNPIRMMEAEHETAGNKLESIRSTSHDFTLPPDACATFSVTYQELERFESDLHKHVHLENNILFPKAIQLERQLIGSQ